MSISSLPDEKKIYKLPERWVDNPYGYSNLDFDYKMDFSEIQKKVIVNESQKSSMTEKFHSQFTIATYNVWGVEVFTFTLLERRLPFIINIFKEINSDILCLQEVSPMVFEFLKQDDWLKHNYHFSETTINWMTRADVVCLILTKIKPLQTYIYTMHGGLFPSDIICTEFNDRIVINTNLHPGSNKSPGITNSKNYVLCRIEQIRILKQIIKTINTDNKPLYLCGDFNIDLNGNESDWPEIDKIKGMSLVDTWSLLKPNDSGFTEDTVVNELRWNTKQIQKQVRYDAIFYTPRPFITPCNIKIFGTSKVFDISFEEFLKVTKNLQLNIDKGFIVDGKLHFSAKDIPFVNWYPSDHFGIIATFKHQL